MRSNDQTLVFGKGLLLVTYCTQKGPPLCLPLSLTPSQKNVMLKDVAISAPPPRGVWASLIGVDNRGR